MHKGHSSKRVLIGGNSFYPKNIHSPFTIHCGVLGNGTSSQQMYVLLCFPENSQYTQAIGVQGLHEGGGLLVFM